MAGGFGTRLLEITKGEVPKPMAKIAGVPLLERAILTLKLFGVTEFFISVSHIAEKIEDYFGNGEKFGVNIEYIREETPLGSGGALYYLKDKVKGDFIVCSADTVFEIDVKKMLSFHRKRKATATLFTHPNTHPYDSDIVLTDRYNRVTGFLLKNAERKGYYKNNVNAGFSILSAKSLDVIKECKKMNFEHDFIATLIENGEKVCAYKSAEYIKDAGTPERFYKVEKEILSGLVENRCYKNKQKAIFIDRDGTLNVYKGFITSHAQIELEKGVLEGVKKINESGYLAIVISNQPVIARGEATFSAVEQTFNKIETLLGEGKAYLDGIYYCPHHTDKGFKGEVKRLKKDCCCRKPKIGLIEKAVKDFNLDLSACFMIGDTEVDVLTGKNAKIPQIQLKNGYKETQKEKPTYVAYDFLDAVNFCLEK